jgi:hypothetical protein
MGAESRIDRGFLLQYQQGVILYDNTGCFVTQGWLRKAWHQGTPPLSVLNSRCNMNISTA